MIANHSDGSNKSNDPDGSHNSNNNCNSNSNSIGERGSAPKGVRHFAIFVDPL